MQTDESERIGLGNELMDVFDALQFTTVNYHYIKQKMSQRTDKGFENFDYYDMDSLKQAVTVKS